MGQQAFPKTSNGGEFGDGASVHSNKKRYGCLRMVKEYKSRFYIVTRCVRMLICSNKEDKY
ncbi:hypothetical protein Fmac_002659 [Flemingia macrophylla]|uniref:Uncharacterized protein n=1 Tax=Flemingia macrophylla TaxID=520843 RepID=A0ABD1NKJ3_9FABA